jgi:phosphoglycerol transferase MdoB-like AlkP superfamily enzyme
MLSKIKFAFYYWLIWIGIFQLARLTFILYNFNETETAGVSGVSKSLFYGTRMDASMATYVLIPVCLFLLTSIFVSIFANRKLYYIYTGIILIPVLLIITCDLPAYKAWGYRLDASTLKYLKTPNEAWASVSNLPVFWFIVGFVVVYLILLKSFNNFLTKQQAQLDFNKNKWLQLSLMLVFTAAQILPLRGGWQLLPINQSTVYYSTDNFSNLSAINVTWNFFNSLSDNLETSKNPYLYLDSNTAKNEIANLYNDDGITTSLIDTTIQQPNIMLVIWESFTKKVVDSMHNGITVTPGFNQLKKEGIYFSGVYATGDRTDKGIVGILSGYPSQPITSIVKLPQKADKLPKLPEAFVKENYQASFYYGGELELANMKSYLLGSGFNYYTQKSDFDAKDQNSKWGAHDGVVKNRIISDFKKIKQPFFTTWLTLSSHEPYDTPIQIVINGTDDESQFTNSLHYADAMVSEFVNECKKQPFWKNTIMIIIADHGHRLPRLKNKIEDFKIPMLWLGGAVAQKGIEINKTCSQIDLAATLLAQLKKDNKAFSWSKNIMSNQSKTWAYFSFNNGFGYIESKKYFIFDNVGKTIIEENKKHDNILYQRGKAMVQKSFGDYLGR